MANTTTDPTPAYLQNVSLPSKKYFTIGEVSKICDLQPHVLRYWEKAFQQLKPSKRSGRRYYQQKDLHLVLQIKYLLHQKGFTIQGAQAQLSSDETELAEVAIAVPSLTSVKEASDSLAAPETSKKQVAETASSSNNIEGVEEVKKELEDLLQITQLFKSYVEQNY